MHVLKSAQAVKCIYAAKFKRLHHTQCILHIASDALHLIQCLLHNTSYTFNKFIIPLFEKSLKPLFQKSFQHKSNKKSLKTYFSKSLKHELKYLSNQKKSLKFRNLSIAEHKLYEPQKFDKVFSVLDDLCRRRATPFQ